MIESIQHIIAVVGCQRSGTTLTGQILGAHPKAVLIDEPDGLYPWFHAMAEGRSDAHRLAATMFHRAGAKYRDPRSRFNDREDGRVLSAAISVLVLKAPNLSYDFEKLAALPVPLNIVYPVRDPRAVVASMARLRHIDFVGNQLRHIEERPSVAAELEAERQALADDRKPPWVRYATVWKVKSGLAPRFRQFGLPVHQFRYEDLVQDPDSVVRDLSHCCGLDDSTLLTGFNGVYVGYGPGGTDRTREIDQAVLRNWNACLDAEREADVLSVAGPLARSFGYV